MKVLMKPHKYGIWITVATIAAGFGVMMLIAWFVTTAVFRGIGEQVAEDGKCFSKTAPRETVEKMIKIKLPTGIENLEVDSVVTSGRECFIYLKFQINALEWKAFLTANQFSVTQGIGQESIRGDWVLSDIVWPYDDSQSYLSGNLSSGREEMTTVAVDISHDDNYIVYVITYLM